MDQPALGWKPAKSLDEGIELLRKQRRDEEPLDGLTEHDKTVLGGAGGKYIHIPHVPDAHNLKRIGGLLQGLGGDMVNLSNRHEFPMRSKTFELRALIDDFNRRVREMTGKGKRKHLENGDG